MPTIKLVAERTATGRVREIYDEIKAVLGTAFVPVNFRAMAHNPDHLETYWRQYKAIMEEGSVVKPIKEIIAMVVSALNNCAAWLEFHTAAVKQLGYTDAQIAEIFMVVGLFNHTNTLMRGLRLDWAGLGGARILISWSSAQGVWGHAALKINANFLSKWHGREPVGIYFVTSDSGLGSDPVVSGSVNGQAFSFTDTTWVLLGHKETGANNVNETTPYQILGRIDGQVSTITTRASN